MRRPTFKQVLRGFGRGVALLVLFVFVLAVASTVALKVVFTPERIKFLLIDQLEGVLHRQVIMDAVSFNPFGGVRVDGFKVLRKTKPWAEPFIESDRFVANFQFWPLLAERRLVLDEIWLTRPKIRLVRFADGSWNFQDMFLSSGTHPAALGPVALSVADARLTNGSIEFIDEARGGRHEATQIQFRVKDFRTSGPFWFSLSFASQHQSVIDDLPPATVDVDGKMNLADFVWNKAQVDLKDLQVRTPSWSLSARGYASDFQHPRGAIDADISPASAGTEIHLKNLKRLVLAPLSAQAAFSFSDSRTLQVKAFQLADAKSRVEGDGDFHFEGSSTTWRLHLKSPGLDVSAIADYVPDLGPYLFGGRLEFETTISSGPAGLGFGRTKLVLQGGRAVFGADNVLRNADVTLAAPPDFKVARLTASNVSASTFGQELSGIDFDAQIQGPDWTFHSLKGVWNGMRWNLRGKVWDFFQPTHLDIRGGADVVKIQELVNLSQRIIEYHKARAGKEPPQRKWFEYVKYGVPKTFPALSGRLAARRVEYRYLTGEDFAIRFDIKGWEPGMKNLNGFAQYAMGPGRILNTTEMMANSKFLRVIFLPFVTLDKISSMGILKGWKEKKTLDYRRIVGDYKSTWGNVRVNELVIDTAEILLSGSGQIDLPAESIQLYVLNRLYKQKGTLPETLTCDDGKPCLAFFVEGDLGVPDARLDLNKIRTQKGADVLNQRLKQFQILKTIIPTE